MTSEEYYKVNKLSYKEYLAYLKAAHGAVPYKYGNKKNHKIGLFIHHDKEDEVPSLSHSDMRKEYPEYQVPEFLTYCDYLEHLLLHIMIGRETNPELNLGLNGPCKYILPAIINYYNKGIKNPKWDIEYYTELDGKEDIFKLMLSEYNELVKNLDIVIEENKTLYLQAEEYLNTKNKALIVLGTGLGKTTTALQYIKKYQVKALVIGPNNLIKTSWNKYEGWVDTITYAGFANKYESINYAQYGLVILDEVHHAGYDSELGKGAKVWGKAIEFLINKGIKVLGLTATPDRTDGIMLGETLFKDCTCIGRSIEDAIINGDIHAFDYITSVYDTDGLTSELKKLGWHGGSADPEFIKLEGQIDLALNNIPSVKKIFEDNMPANKRKGIIFIQDIDSAKEAKDIFFGAYPDMRDKTKELHSKMKKEEIKEVRDWFEKTDEGYLIAINMISEGAHYPGVNTLIMFRKTESYVLFSQQLGRIITLAKNENPKAIVFDLVNNVNSIRYNDRVKSESGSKLTHEIKKALERRAAQKSEQIIVKDYCQDICERLYELKNKFGYFWSEEDDELLKYWYPIEGKECYKRIPGATESAVQGRAHLLNLQAPGTVWTEQEDVLIKQYYPLEGLAMIARLPGKTKEQLANHVRHLKVKKSIIGRVAKPVLCVETGEVFSSIKEAATKYKTSGIYNAINDNSISCGYHWKYAE